MRNISSRLHTCELTSYMFILLKSLDWCTVFAACRTVNQYWETLYNILKQLVCDYVPLMRPRRNYNHPLPRCVRASVLRKRRLWRKWRTNPTAKNKRKFNTASRRCSKAVHEYHVQQEESLLRNGAQKFYRYISNQLHPKSGDILLQGPNGQPKSASDIAGCFAEEFAKNFSSTTGPTTTQGQNLTVPNNATHCQQNCNISPLEHVSITYTTVY